MGLVIHPSIKRKLINRHGVSEDEIIECFANRTAGFLTDSREEHKTDPVTQWFVAETNHGRRLKVMFMHLKETNEIVIKSAYEATDEVARIYIKHA